MTELTITPKISDKTAKFKGTIAAGEHVAVTIKGGAEWLGEDEGANLTLRVLDLVTGRTLAVFPRPQETMEEDETPDAWSASTEDANDLYCKLNLNTTRMVAAARHMLRVPVLFVLGDTDDPRTLYFRDRHEVEYWPERIGDTVPYDLGKWPGKVDEWSALIEEWTGQIGRVEMSATRIEGGVSLRAWDGKGAQPPPVVVWDGKRGVAGPEGREGKPGAKGDRGEAALVTRMRVAATGKWHDVSLVENTNGQLTMQVDQTESPGGGGFDADVKTGKTGAVARSLEDRFADVFNVMDFGAVGDGNANDTDNIQAAMDAAEANGGGQVFFPSGRYLIGGESVTVPSNVHVCGCGASSVIVQNGSYDFSGDEDEQAIRKNAVDYNCFMIKCGMRDVTISDLRLEGPCCAAGGDYETYPVEHKPYSTGILVRGRDYRDRKALAAVVFATEWNRIYNEDETGDHESHNIRIERVDIEGFGDDGIQLDNVTDAWVTGCSIQRCGRGGVRVYGGLRCHVNDNIIKYIEPGDTLNKRGVTRNGKTVLIGGNRSYGISFTKVYRYARHQLQELEDEGDLRQSSYCEACRNFVYHSFGWKALDTHGGTHIDFIGNFIKDCHIGIGVDKAMNNNTVGAATPSHIKIIGNTIIREREDQMDEGDGDPEADPSANPLGCCGAGIFVTAHDATDANIGRHAVVTDNIVDGFGEVTRFGAVYYCNWNCVVHANNVIRNSRRIAICLEGSVRGTFTGDVIDDVRQVTVGTQTVQNGIAVVAKNVAQSGAAADYRGFVDCLVSGMTFINRQETEMTAIYGANPADGYDGLVVSGDNSFIGFQTIDPETGNPVSGSGAIARYNSAEKRFFPCKVVAAGLVTCSSSGQTITYSASNGMRIYSVARNGVGNVSVKLDLPPGFEPATKNAMCVSLTPYPGSTAKRFACVRNVFAPGETYTQGGVEYTRTHYEIQVLMYELSVGTGNAVSVADADGSFYITVFGY